MKITTRAPRPEDKDDWAALYRGYADHYGVPQTDEMRETVWGWLMDPAAEVSGFVAERGGTLLGLTHYRPFKSPLRAATNGFLDDLYVDPGARGSGAAALLVDAVTREARDRGWKTLRWITADDNYRARALYDKVASRTQWVTYDIPL